ncbi:MAG: formyltetrahydrofolate deformylase [Myxococcales bacterium]|nr:formyltetrahydrofolate deformylase [Myxococcales bacterium]
MTESRSTWILTASCPDRPGIVAAISGLLAERRSFIREAAHHSDELSGRFFTRVVFHPAVDDSRCELVAALGPIARRFELQWRIDDASTKPRLLLMVSKHGHCLNDLLYRYRAETLPVEIPAIVSNHTDFESLAQWHEIPFFHLPVTASTKAAQEAQLVELIARFDIDLVVLARYMQVLSESLCERLAGRCINIHHSFLPGFKGARPYRKAAQRGVKLIGATAHYVTADLDEGPIIEQAVERVDHTYEAKQLAAVSRDIENVVLARAIQWHVERRVLIADNRTVVFR